MLPLSISPEAAPTLLGALAAVSERPQDERTRHLARFVLDELGADAPASSPARPEPAELAAAIEGDDARTAAVQRLVLAAMLVPPLTRARLDLLEVYAAALGRASEPALVDLRRTLAGHHRRLTASLMRRFPPTQRIRNAWTRGSFAQRWRFVKAMLRVPDARTAARYRELGELDEATLGRRFFDHCRANGFPLPGERRGLPEPMVFHDMIHALTGASTAIDDEIRIAGFEAARMGERGFTMLEFALLLFNLGAQLPTDAKPLVGAVDVDVLLRAYAKGRSATLDVIEWDPWADVTVGVEELRERYGVGA